MGFVSDPMLLASICPVSRLSVIHRSGTRSSNRRTEGLIFPLDAFANEIYLPYQDRIKEIGEEAATTELMTKSFEEALGVVKWEPTPMHLQPPRTSLGPTPDFIVNPAWSRAQNIKKSIFGKVNDRKIWQVSEKLDGVTMQVYKISAGSRWMVCLKEIAGGYPGSMVCMALLLVLFVIFLFA